MIAFTTEAFLFAASGMRLTTRIRRQAFTSILQQEATFFDDPKNNTNILCTRLAADASKVQGCTGVKIGLLMKNLSSLGVALGIAFYFSWKLTLLMIAFIPLIIIGGMLEMQLVMGDEQKASPDLERCNLIAGEAIYNIGTVASMNQERKIFKNYNAALQAPAKRQTRKCLLLGIGYGYSQCIMFFTYAAVFRLGLELVIDRETSFEDVFKVLTAVLFGAMAVAQNSSLAPDFAEAQLAAKRIFNLIDLKPTIDAYSAEGLSPDHCKGDFAVISASFQYPLRPEAQVLKNISLMIKPGQTVALVGHSGCGKSTIVQLLQRFYDCNEGEILIDGTNIKKFNVKWLRQQMGLVAQEPVLFDLTIKENILLGDVTRKLTDEDVIAAATLANAHSFVTSLPQGYDTMVGSKGGQLSGGQKQRIAIARALIREPKFLLLDEATSALDYESEKVVQAALESASKGRTCLVVSHRLSTIQSADKIFVIDDGQVVEVGTNDELMALKGAYYNLVSAQQSTE